MPYLLVPRVSTVQINCTAQTGNSRSVRVTLSENLADDSRVRIRIRTGSNEMTISDDGAFRLQCIETPEMPQTLRLLSNDTERSNGMEIVCGCSGANTTLFVFGKS